MKKYIASLTLSLLIAVVVPSTAFAHIVVTPDEAAVGTRTTFVMSVPNEKEVAVTELKLAIPSGLKSVQPTVHAGWTIDIETDADKNVKAITWKGGEIPAGQRDDFSLRGQAPAKTTTLEWKAYQTYADGTIVAWDKAVSDDSHDDENETSGPLSKTKIVDDLSDKSTVAETEEESSNLLPLAIGLGALVVSVVAVTRTRKS